MATLRTALAAAVVSVTTVAGLTAAPPEPIDLTGHTGAVTTITWAADGTTLATAGDDRTIRRWDTGTGRQTASLEDIARDGYGGPVFAFTTDLKTVAVNYWGEITVRPMTGGDATVKIDPILDRGQRSAFRPDVYAMAFSPDGKHLATAGSTAAVGGRHGLPGGIVIVWDAATGKMVHKSDRLSTAAGSLVWSPDGKSLAVGTNGAGGELPEAGHVWVWDAATGKVIHDFPVKAAVEPGEWASAADVAFGPAGKRIAVAVKAGGRAKPAGLVVEDSGPELQVRDLKTGAVARPVAGLTSAVDRVAFGPAGDRLATAGRDKAVRVWTIKSGKKVAEWACEDRPTAVAFSPDGNFLAAGTKDGTIQIWPIPAAQ